MTPPARDWSDNVGSRMSGGGTARARPAIEPADAATPTRPAIAAASGPRIANAMSVDVEDYFQVSAFAGVAPRAGWEGHESRVERNVQAVLDLFSERGVRATFFTLGWIAERHPALIGRIAAEGHEVSSHGYQHIRVREQSPNEFRADVRKTKRILEDISGTPVRGYRAASFSIDSRTPWAFEILAEEGHAYSSSVYPIRHDHYGMPEAPRFAFRPNGPGGLIEVPVTTVSVFGRNIPCGGGGYFRLAPYGFSRWAMRRVNNRDRQSCVFYFHPWEIDPDQPRMADISLKARLRHYTNLRGMRRRLAAALSDFAWDRMDRIFLDSQPRD